MSKWKCEQCKHWFWNKDVEPTKLKACVFYGDKGKAPFRKPCNDGVLLAYFNYCGGCL